MIKVRISKAYDYPNIMLQTPGGNGIWNEILFTEDKTTKCDFLVVLKRPKDNLLVRCIKGGKFLFVQEPIYEKQKGLLAYFPYFDKVFSSDKGLIAENVVNIQNCLPWHIGESYDFLVKLPPNKENLKQDKTSWVTQNKNKNPGHKPRLEFIEFLKKEGFDFDLFGRGFEPIDKKFDGVYPYKYNVVMENYIGPNYWTEKLSDAFLGWTMPFCYGCSNIEKYFPEGSFLKIDPNQPKKSLRIMQEAIEQDLWKKNLNKIEEARKLVLDKYQLFPFVESLINNIDTSTRETSFIPGPPITRGKRIKSIIINNHLSKKISTFLNK